MVLIERIFTVIFHYKSKRAIDHQGLCQFAPKGLDWQDLSGRKLDVVTYQIYMDSEDFFPLINVAILIPSVDPRGLIGRIYEGDY